jgi:hypothetical protein
MAATDACGNTGTQTQTITFTRDTQVPVITLNPATQYYVIQQQQILQMHLEQ